MADFQHEIGDAGTLTAFLQRIAGQPAHVSETHDNPAEQQRETSGERIYHAICRELDAMSAASDGGNAKGQ